MREILADTVVMIRPKAFGYNPETAESNAFQKDIGDIDTEAAKKAAVDEFDRYVAALEGAGVNVLVFEDLESPETPDSVFPNNWFCTMPGGEMYTFPMESPTRRTERRGDLLEDLSKAYGYSLNEDLIAFEADDKALEGTGSLILDHEHKLAYAAISSRTDKDALLAFEALSGYLVIPFYSYGPKGEEIYHTNVMLCLGPDFAILGTETLRDEDRDFVVGTLERSGKTILHCDNAQVFEGFAGNSLCLKNKDGKRVLAMSKEFEKRLTNAQRNQLVGEFGCEIISADIPTIEHLGGGSARCMLAEVFKPEEKS